MTWATRSASAVLAACALAFVGCGTPGPPLPPSLHLPGRVGDLAGTRDGNQVTLKWTMPRRDTDGVALNDPIAARICRSEPAQPCISIADVQASRGAAATYSETLPPVLADGPARPLHYSVELRNRGGRSAGSSNVAIVVAGHAPAVLAGLSATIHKSGIVLEWQQPSPDVSVRLHRTLLTPTPPKERGSNILAAGPEPAQQDLLIPSDTGRALDRSITFGRTYQYRAQRIARVTIEGHVYELAGEFSVPVQVEAADIFPPDVPSGLVAVASAPEPGVSGQPPSGQFSIDLNWQPSADADLAGYIVYRRQNAAPWQRVSGSEPIVAPAFHDTGVQPGQTYSYSVSAIDRAGHESARSREAQESVPQN